MLQQIETFFAGLETMGLGLPSFVLVPLIIILTIIGVVVLVKAVQGLIRLIFRNKGKEFVKGFNDHTMSVEERTKALAKDIPFDKQGE